jgi:SulP family sulfate permease
VPWGAERRFSPVDELEDTALECPQLKLVRMEGEVYFGAAQHVESQLKAYRRTRPGQKHLLVMARSMNAIDLAGLRVWWQEWRLRRQAGGGLYWHRPRSRVIAAVGRADMPGLFGDDNVFRTKHDAIAAIVPRLNPDVCFSCRARIFHECAGLPGADEARAEAAAQHVDKTRSA